MTPRAFRSCQVLSGAVSALMLAVGSALPLAAEESGQWFGKAVLVEVSSKTAKVQHGADQSVSVVEYDGVVFNGDNKPFLEKARYQVVHLFDVGAAHGYKTFTDPDGSKVFAKYILKEMKLPDLRGVFEFTGGTGKYAGITGSGEYHVVIVSDTASWDELRGEYKIPAAASGAASDAPATGTSAPAAK